MAKEKTRCEIFCGAADSFCELARSLEHQVKPPSGAPPLTSPDLDNFIGRFRYYAPDCQRPDLLLPVIRSAYPNTQIPQQVQEVVEILQEK